MTLQAVVFDLDDTLLDFMGLKRVCIDAAVDAMLNNGLTLPKTKAVEKIYQIYYSEGLESQEVFNKFLLQELGAIDYKMLAAAVLAYKKTRSSIVPYPGVTATLTELLRMGLKLGILTDAPKMAAWSRLIDSHLQDYFDVVVGLEDTGKRKPHPDPFKLVLSKLGVQPAQALMVGDYFDRDMLGGRAIGMQTAYVMYSSATTRKPDEETEGIVDYKLQSVKDIVGIVKKINSEEGKLP